MSNNYTVYKHTSPSEKVYIGITKVDPKKRWKNGLGYRTQTRFYRAIQKYGWENFEHEILYEGLSEAEAKVREIELIAAYNSADKNYGYNVTLGGEAANGYVPPEDVRLKISRANSGKTRSPETRERIAQSKRGIPLSAETRQKLSEAHADISGERNPMYGKRHSEESKRKMSETKRRKYAERMGLTIQPIELSGGDGNV